MSEKRPNILFFFTDDQRFDTIRALGNPHLHTPTMDRLSAQGTAFTHAHIPGGQVGAVCMPSRAMLHTGRTLFHLEGAGQSIRQDHILLGEHLQAQGYATFGTGKWHNGPAAYARSFSDGDEIFFGGMGDHWNVPAYHYDPTGRYASQLPLCPDPFASKEVEMRQADHVVAGKHSSELFADATIRFLEAHQSEDPFFAYLSFMAPHDPRTMPQEFQDLYDPEKIPLPANFMGGHPFDNGDLKVRDEVLMGFPRDPDEVREHIADYYAMITHLDAQMARVLEALKATGRTDNTIVVFAGDNGLAVGQHGLLGKQSMYEHSTRVPLVMSGPGIAAGERRDAYVYLLDIYPTLCELAGLPTPGSVEGRSLISALRDANEAVRDTLYFAYKDVQRAVKDERFKLVEYVVGGRRTTQLFDLEEDPLELHNLAGDPAWVKVETRLRGELLRLRDEWDDAESEWGQVFWDGFGGT